MNKIIVISALVFLPVLCMEKKQETKSVFIDESLESNVRIFVNKKTDECLTREDYVSYLKVINREKLDGAKYTVKFLSNFRGSPFEVLKDTKKD